jgi:putative oxygen-independent coproporphyrinogen III oxidase
VVEGPGARAARVIPIRAAPAPARPGARGAPHGGPPAGPGHLEVPLSLYVHIPWCVRKCPYCDFNSHTAPQDEGGIPEREYLDALRADLESTLPLVWGRRIRTVFLGGGTPSLLSPGGLARLLSDVRARLPLDPDCEITMEANPGTFEAARFQGFRDAGVNRISLGIQSFDDDRLRALGRIHDGRQAVAAAQAAQRIFGNFNLDLMTGLPGQDVAGALADVRQAIALSPTHVSTYALTLEAGTPFFSHPPSLPGEDVVEEIEGAVAGELRRAGFARYEVSAWARAGAQCRHNLNYWTFGDYLGIGAGAHAKITTHESIAREERRRVPAAYLEDAGQGRFVSNRRTLTPEQIAFEFALCAFRISEGFTPSLFEARTGLPFALLGPGLERARGRGLLEEDGSGVRASGLGWRFLSDLQEFFLPKD